MNCVHSPPWSANPIVAGLPAAAAAGANDDDDHDGGDHDHTATETGTGTAPCRCLHMHACREGGARVHCKGMRTWYAPI